MSEQPRRFGSILERLDVRTVISVIPAIVVAYFGYLGIVQQQTTEYLRIQSADQAERDAVAAQQRQLEAAALTQKQTLLQTYIPRMLSSDPAQKRQAIATFQELYPNETADILGRLAALESASAPAAEAAPIATSGPVATPTVEPTPAAGQAVPTPQPTPRPTVGPAPTTSVLAAALQVAQAAPRANWLVVAGSDADRTGAEDEVDAARQKGYSQLAVYHRQGWYATTIGTFFDELAATSSLIDVRARMRGSAFVVNRATWCPQAERQDLKDKRGSYEYYECPPTGTPLAAGATCTVTDRTGAFQLWDGPGRPYSPLTETLEPGTTVSVLEWARSQDDTPWFRVERPRQRDTVGVTSRTWIVSYEVGPDGGRLTMDCSFEPDPPFNAR